MVSFRGRARYESDGYAMARGVRLDDAELGIRPGCGPTDGQPGSTAPSTMTGTFRGTNSSSASPPSPPGSGPPDRSSGRGREELVRMLEETDRDKHPIAITQRVVNGMRCYVVESKSPDGKWGGETIISPRQGYLPIGRKWTSPRQDLFLVHPARRPRGRPRHLGTRPHRGRVDLGPRRRGLAPEFAPADPDRGVSAAADPAGGRVSARDPLRSRRDRPPAGLVLPQGPLVAGGRGDAPGEVRLAAARLLAAHELWSHSERKLEDQPAPPLRIATWLNAKPVDLAALRGKVVLVEFWNISAITACPIDTAPLRELYAAYHPAGLEIVSIHAPTEDPDDDPSLCRGIFGSSIPSASTRGNPARRASPPRRSPSAAAPAHS